MDEATRHVRRLSRAAPHHRLTLPPQTAMKMYIDLARIHTHKQYMFLSPLGAKIYRDTAGQDIKVIKLPDPPEDKQQPTIPQAFGAQ